MLHHLLKLIWKRKSRNLLLSVEIALAFVLVFAIAAIAGRYYQLAQLPVGFDYQNVWSVDIRMPDPTVLERDPNLRERFKQSLLELPEVEQASFTSHSPYEMATWQGAVRLPNSPVSLPMELMVVDDDFFAALNIELQQGRFFSSQDQGGDWTPIVIDRHLAQAAFGDGQAVDQWLEMKEGDVAAVRRLRVVGVIETFRNRGEFMTPTSFVFDRGSLRSAQTELNALLLKLKPGTPRVFEVKLSERLKALHADFTYTIKPMSESREVLLRMQTSPLVVLSVVAGFLLLMVAFGLFGVLWQNTTQRIPEVGLRRALGADRGGVYRQILFEQVLLSSLAIALASLLLVQLPLTGAFGDDLDWPLFIGASLLSALVIYAVSILCSLYPAWLASRLSPTQALRFE